MKKYSWLILILYFSLFVVFGVIFYLKYLDQFLKSGSEPQPVETLQSAEYIYYSQANNLFRLSVELRIDPTNPERVERFQSTGVVNSLDINKTGSFLVYEVKNSQGLREIWQVDIQSREAAKIAFEGADGLTDLQEFVRPKFSPDGKRLALIGLGSIDQLLSYDIAQKTFSPLSTKFAVKIADLAWVDDQKLVFCTTNLAANTCYEIDSASSTEREILKAEVSQLAMGRSGLIYLAKDQDSFNLFLLDLKTLESDNLSGLKVPKKVNRFSVNEAGDIGYDVTDGELSDIYFVQADGSGKIQLTSDGKSSEAILNATGRIAFQKHLDGIYTIKTDKEDLQKIANITEQVNLLLWR